MVQANYLWSKTTWCRSLQDSFSIWACEIQPGDHRQSQSDWSEPGRSNIVASNWCASSTACDSAFCWFAYIRVNQEIARDVWSSKPEGWEEDSFDGANEVMNKKPTRKRNPDFAATLQARCPADFLNDYNHEDFGLSAWVTRLERWKGAKEEVKRPFPARSWAS